MAASIYITRSDINDLIPDPISAGEFRELVDNDPSLVWAEESGLVPKEELAYIKPRTSAIWKEGDEKGSLWFVLDSDGTMTFGYRKGSTKDIYLKKIFEVAKKLKAYVQTDDGEILLNK